MDTTILPQWLTAIGTVGSVAVALFSKPIIRIINRPKISLIVTEKAPCFEIQNRKSSSSEEEKAIIMRVKIINNGRDNANNASLFVDSYYKKCEDGRFVFEELAPMQLREYSDLTPNMIASKLHYHFNIASVHRIDEKTEADGKNEAKVFHRLFLLAQNNDFKLGKGTFVIPIKFFSSNVKSKTFYVEISWNNDTFSSNKQYYGFRLLDKSEFKSLKIK